ncbi:MAG: hypothetical protein ABGX37_05800 [Methylococcales bacterium]
MTSIYPTQASINKNINPDEALLVELIHNTAAFPAIIFAHSLSYEDTSVTQGDNTVFSLQGVWGNIMFNKWTFPETLQFMPKAAENGYHHSGPELEICDIVILTRYYRIMGNPQYSGCPFFIPFRLLTNWGIIR